MIGVLCVLATILGAAPAEAMELDGKLIQDGLITGRTTPGARVRIEERTLRVSREGMFVFGIGRDAGPVIRLRLTHPDGRRETHALRIAARRYDVQRIDGLPRRAVSPSAAEMKRIRIEAGHIRAARERDTARTMFAAGFIWPTRGIVSGVYGSRRILNGKPRRPHPGIDIAVLASAPGIVSLAEPACSSTALRS